MRRMIGILTGLIAAAALLLGLWSSQQAAEAATWEAKVDPWVLETAAANAETEFLVYLTEQADLSNADSLATKEAKGAYVYKQLTAVAQRTQPALIAQLDALGVSYRRYWITNMIWVRGSSSVMETLARREDVAHLYANPAVAMPTLPIDASAAIFGPEAIEWNIIKVNADDAWALGYTGQNVVVAGQDTGYYWSHTGLKTQYRGWDGVTADHNYNWHDSIHSGGGSCGADSPFPCDDHGHGTHTMGTIVGNDLDPNNPGWPASAANAVGMAPGAEWISCRNMNVGDGTPATYSECYEWFIAPYPVGGDPMTDGDPTKAPDVINNSWGCPVSEGCSNPDVLLSVVQAVRSAGIVTVHSAGNEGSGCSSVQTPAAIYDESFSVAAVNSSDAIAGFSSRGPVTVDGSNRMKPDISAPGVNIRSTTRDGGYQGGWQGTSMAGPHVAGLVALIISANPSLAGQVDVIEQIIAETAVPLTTTQGCGGDTSTDVPNNVYGWGRIDALAAVELALQWDQPQAMSVSKTASAAVIMPGDLLTYTLTVTNLHSISTTTNVVLSDTLPDYTDFFTATQPYQQNGSIISWEAPTLGPAETWQVMLVVTVAQDAASDIVNQEYGVSSTEVSYVAGTPVTTTIIPPHQLALNAAVWGTAVPGETLTYTFVVSNPHPVAALHNLVLTDTLPEQTSLITATQPFTMNGSIVQWDHNLLNAGEMWSVELVVQVSPTATGVIENWDYGVVSGEVTPVSGPPIVTPVVQYVIYLPYIEQPAP